MIQLSNGSASKTPNAPPCTMIAVGKVRNSLGNHFISRMQRHRAGRPFAGAERDAASHQGPEPDRAHHRKLGQRPDQAHREQYPARLNAINEKAGRDRRERKQQVEARADQAELARAELQFLHDRDGSDPDHRLVGEIDHRE